MTIGKIGDRITWLGIPGIIITVGKGLARYTIEIEGKNSTRLEVFSQREFSKNIEIVCDNSTCAVGSVQGSLLLESPENSSYLDSVSGTNGAPESSILDIQESLSCQKLNSSNDSPQLANTQTSSPQVHPVNPSVSKGKSEELAMNETASPSSYQPLPAYDQSILSLKMCPTYYLAHTDQAWGKEPISGILCGSYTSAGTMQNGCVSAADTLEAPSLEKDYCWLESPGGLSSLSSQPPGLTKLENQLKSQGMLLKGEVLDPAFLLSGLGIPEKFLNPLECRGAAELLDDSGKPPETFSIQGLQESHSTECSTSNQSGSLYRYEKVVKGNRYPKNPSSWYYGYSYVIQIDGRWCDRSKSVSIKKLPFVEQMITMKRNYLEILGFLR